jgi:hypothetical protein
LLLKPQKPVKVEQLKAKYVAYEYTWGSCCKELIAGSPFIFTTDNFLAFPAGNRFFNLCGIRLPAIG